MPGMFEELAKIKYREQRENKKEVADSSDQLQGRPLSVWSPKSQHLAIRWNKSSAGAISLAQMEPPLCSSGEVLMEGVPSNIATHLLFHLISPRTTHACWHMRVTGQLPGRRCSCSSGPDAGSALGMAPCCSTRATSCHLHTREAVTSKPGQAGAFLPGSCRTLLKPH